MALTFAVPGTSWVENTKKTHRVFGFGLVLVGVIILLIAYFLDDLLIIVFLMPVYMGGIILIKLFSEEGNRKNDRKYTFDKQGLTVQTIPQEKWAQLRSTWITHWRGGTGVFSKKAHLPLKMNRTWKQIKKWRAYTTTNHVDVWIQHPLFEEDLWREHIPCGDNFNKVIAYCKKYVEEKK